VHDARLVAAMNVHACTESWRSTAATSPAIRWRYWIRQPCRP